MVADLRFALVSDQIGVEPGRESLDGKRYAAPGPGQDAIIFASGLRWAALILYFTVVK